MSKRLAKFRRNERDFYPTPREAVEPLIGWIEALRVKTFAEPCCGDGALIEHLQSFGFACEFSNDIRGGNDALMLPPSCFAGCDAIITNPPHERELMHAMIDRFRSIAPTWLLIDWDWAATAQAQPYLRCCVDILPIGRVRWIPGSPHVGFDNYAWYHFRVQHGLGPRLLVRW